MIMMMIIMIIIDDYDVQISRLVVTFSDGLSPRLAQCGEILGRNQPTPTVN